MRRSATRGLGAKIAWTCLSTSQAKTMPASVSATAWTSEPASEAGDVAPAWPAEISCTGKPARTAASSVSQASSANRIGGTTWHTITVRKGRARNAASPPAIQRQILAISATLHASVTLIETGFAVPARQA